MLCHLTECGCPSVVTITVDTGGSHLAHYPSCALHIVEVANMVRRQNRLSIESSPEALRIERDGLLVQMEELLDRAVAADRPFTFDESEMWERWRRRVDELPVLIRCQTVRRRVIESVEGVDPPALDPGPLPPK